MNITIQKESIVKPAEELPHKVLWTSNVDQLFKLTIPCVYFYRPNESKNFFDVNVLKGSLAKALVTFYPLGGRLMRNKEGRIEINCNGEGALFVEAETDTSLDDLGDFAPTAEYRQLIPKVDTVTDISAYPLLLLQRQRISLERHSLTLVTTGESHWRDTESHSRHSPVSLSSHSHNRGVASKSRRSLSQRRQRASDRVEGRLIRSVARRKGD